MQVAGFMLGLFFTLKMEATRSSGTMVESQRTIWRYIAENSPLLYYYKHVFKPIPKN
jgi:hypothetical protein